MCLALCMRNGGKIYLYYYTGGATMGSGHLYEIKESGQVARNWPWEIQLL